MRQVTQDQGDLLTYYVALLYILWQGVPYKGGHQETHS
jgi:hypothetical protein